MTDDGGADPRLADALAGWTGDPTPAARARVLAALAGARVFAAVAARALGTTGTGALRQESAAEMALLSVRGAQGARALPVFADGHQVQRWRAEARPVPVSGPQACAAAVEDGADALLVDPPGAGFVVARGELLALAAGQVPVPGSAVTTRTATAALTEPGTPVDPALLAALGLALTGEPVAAARVLAGPDGPVLGVVPRAPLPPEQLAALADRVARRLGPHLPADGLDLAAVPPDGGGVPVPLREARRRRLSARRRR